MDNISSGASSPVSAERDLDLARDGDQAAFARLVGPLQPELHAHCYRMLGAAHDADDALQESLLRAWRGLPDFAGRSTLRTWLYTVVTRVCVDLARRRGRRALPLDLGPASHHAVLDDAPATEVTWLGPYARQRVDELPASTPGARLEQREAVELAFVAALQHLPGNQRAALLLFEVLGYSADEIATMMQTTTGSVNSALQRARATVARRVPQPTQQATLRKLGDRRLRAVVEQFATALERRDADALIDLLAKDVTWSMPPLPHWYAGLPAVSDFAVRVPITGCGMWRTLATSMNGQPAVACYLRPDGAAAHDARAITVLSVRDEHVGDITSFIGAEHFQALGLPGSLPPAPPGELPDHS